MNKTDKIADVIKENFDSISVPNQLDLVIEQGIERAKEEKQRSAKNHRFIKHRGMRPLVAALGVVVMLGLLGNSSKTFANAVEDIPVIGYIVKTLTFIDHETGGGQMNDGLNLSDMERVSQEKTESIFISFTIEDDAVDLASAYAIKAYEQPNILAFTISGIRMMDMLKDFEVISQSALVEDVYRVMTLDDSMVRFNLVLNPKVTYEVIEHGSPARLEIKLKEANTIEAKTLYTVRSYSYPAGESFAMMEEGLMHRDLEYRILKDTQENFVYEFGRFANKAQAQAYIDQFDGTIEIFMEQMDAYALPDSVLQTHP